MRKNEFIKIKLLLLLITLLTSCATGTTLRTARTLEQGQIEFSGGASGTQYGHVSPVVIAAYGITDRIEIEGRYEDRYFAVTPRLQLLRSETAFVDCLTFFEVGYDIHNTLIFGPGVVIGRRWQFIEPYTSYRFRHACSLYFGASNIHFVKFGSRFYIPCFWGNPDKQCLKWFIGVEAGPTISGSDALFEWGANIGFDY